MLSASHRNAAAIALAVLAGSASPGVAQTTAGAGATAPEVYFDLGIDASKLPQNAADARKYFASQSPETQHVLLASCRNYVNHPIDAAMPETIIFCKAIVNGLT